ncbi:MAG TPA: cysteine--tRNA ligase [Phycisphaerales bacterium]|nr:cysteine--tRNA ligase [Phycisphaerales bacterium]
MPDALMLYNTLTHAVEPLKPADPNSVTFYTCGPTVYDDAHIGNFRAFLAADLLRRFIESPLCTVTAPDGSPHRGPRRVVHVMNITDVGHMTDDSNADGAGEDKMALAGRRIAEAKKSGKIPADAGVDPADPRAIARFFADRFLEDARALGLKVAAEAERDNTLMPRASEQIDAMRAIISRLLEKGAAYTAGPPGARAIYFDVRTFDHYGRLSGNTLEKLRGGAGGRVSESHQTQKRHPADFLLWKEDEAHIMKWPAPESPHTAGWTKGYPGWHIECTAMSLGRLVPGGLERIMRSPDGAEIDLHSGGEDNIFPHHECEIAQSCALTGSPTFARHWFHTRYLMVEGEKMSKSKGTFYTARDLFALGHEPAAVRLELIKTHYRANADFSIEGLKASARFVDRLRRFAGACPEPAETRGIDHPALRAVAESLHDDLNIAGALGEINKWINSTPSPTPEDARAVRTIDAVLGLLDRPRASRQETEIGVYTAGVSPSEEIERLLAERAAARSKKDFARADAIRDELASRGFSIKDIAGGRVEVGRT